MGPGPVPNQGSDSSQSCHQPHTLIIILDIIIITIIFAITVIVITIITIVIINTVKTSARTLREDINGKKRFLSGIARIT